jgi:cytochrome b561
MDQDEELHPQKIVASPRRHDPISMTLHWITLLLIIVLFGGIWAHEQASDGDTAELFLTVHRSAGALIWVVTLARIAWKGTRAHAPLLPVTVPRLQRWAARANEYALYLLLIAQPVTGFVQSIARGKAFPMLGLSIPSLMARDRAVTHFFQRSRDECDDHARTDRAPCVRRALPWRRHARWSAALDAAAAPSRLPKIKTRRPGISGRNDRSFQRAP